MVEFCGFKSFCLSKFCFTFLGLNLDDFQCSQLLNFLQLKKVRSSDTQVLVASAQKKLVKERMKICRLLWDNNIKVWSWVNYI